MKPEDVAEIPPPRPDLRRELRFIIPLRPDTVPGMLAEGVPLRPRTAEVHVFREGSLTWRYYAGTSEGGAIVYVDGRVVALLRPRDILRMLAAWMGELS